MILFSKCKVNPGEEGFVEKFKSLHPDFMEPLELQEVKEKNFFAYVVATYDIESPFVIKYGDWAQRRRETAKAAGLPMRGTRYLEEAEDIILGKNPVTNRIIARYLFLQNDIDFIKYQTYQALYYQQVKLSLGADFDNPGHYDKLKENIDKLSTDIKSLQTAIFHGDETKEMKMALYDFVAKISLDIRPEDIAERKLKGEDVVDDGPYPGYVTGKMTFIGDE